MPLRVVIADDHRLVLEGVRRALESTEDFEVVGETHSGAHVLPLVSRHHPDLVLMDVRMPGMDGLTALDQIRKRHPKVKVVLISAGDRPEEIQGALARGAAGYIVKSINPIDIPSAVRQAYEGTAFYSPGSTQTAEQTIAKDTGLTEREIDFLKALIRGMSNKQISQELFVTEQTVKFHLSNIYRKIGVANRAGALRYAHEHGIVAAEPAHD